MTAVNARTCSQEICSPSGILHVLVDGGDCTEAPAGVRIHNCFGRGMSDESTETLEGAGFDVVQGTKEGR